MLVLLDLLVVDGHELGVGLGPGDGVGHGIVTSEGADGGVVDLGETLAGPLGGDAVALVVEAMYYVSGLL